MSKEERRNLFRRFDVECKRIADLVAAGRMQDAERRFAHFGAGMLREEIHLMLRSAYIADPDVYGEAVSMALFSVWCNLRDGKPMYHRMLRRICMFARADAIDRDQEKLTDLAKQTDEEGLAREVEGVFDDFIQKHGYECAEAVEDDYADHHALSNELDYIEIELLGSKKKRHRNLGRVLHYLRQGYSRNTEVAELMGVPDGTIGSMKKELFACIRENHSSLIEHMHIGGVS